MFYNVDLGYRAAICCDLRLPGPMAEHFTKGPSDVVDHATSEMAMGSKLGIDATKKLPGERSWPPLIKMDEVVQKKIHASFNK